jgi:ribose transport system substrate-binding protein
MGESMIKKRKWLVVLIAALMVCSMSMAACQGEEPAADGPAAAPPAEGGDAEAGADANTDAEAGADANAEDVVLSPEELVNHEIYKHLDDNALTGVTLPILKDRSDLNKALPVEQKKEVVVGWSEASMTSAWFAGVQKGAEQYAKEFGYDLRFYVANTFDVAQQTADIETMITTGVDILVLDAVDVQAQAVDIDKCIAAGIPVISMYPMDERVPVITAVTANYYEVSYKAGYHAAQQFDEPIEMAIIPGQIGHPISNARVCGFLGGWCYGKQVQKGVAKPYREDGMLAGYNAYLELVKSGSVNLPDFDANIVGMANGNFDDVGGMTAAEDLLTAYPNISLIFPDNDHEGSGAIKVLEQRGLLDKVKVMTGCDGDTNALTLIKDGKLGATGYNNPVAVTKAVFELIHMIYEEGYDANNMPAITPLYHEIFTQENYQDVYEPDTEYGKIFPVEFKTVDELNEETLSKSST